MTFVKFWLAKAAADVLIVLLIIAAITALVVVLWGIERFNAWRAQRNRHVR